MYHLTSRMALTGPLELDLVERAWRLVVDRHDALRTSLVRRDGRIVQEVYGEVDAGLEIGVLEPSDEDALQHAHLEAHARPFDLSVPPLVRLTALAAGDRVELQLCGHHSVVDGASSAILWSELASAYSDLASGRTPLFADDAVPFAVFAAEQLAAIESGSWDDSVGHWRARLALSAPTTLESRARRPAQPTHAGAMLRYELGDAATAAAGAACRSLRVTPFAIVLAALQAAFVRGGAGSRIVLGVVADNRVSKRDRQIVGYLANTLAVAGHVSSADSLRDVVVRAGATTWDVLEHQKVPFPVVFPELDTGTQRLFADGLPVLLSVVGADDTVFEFGGAQGRLVRMPVTTARSDLTLFVELGPATWAIDAEYATELFDADAVRDLLVDVEEIIVAAGSDPDARVGSVGGRCRATPRYAAAPQAQLRPLPDGLDDSVVTRILGMCAAEFDVPPVAATDNLYFVGVHSLQLLRLVGLVEDEFGVFVDISAWLAEPTPAGLADQVHQSRGPFAI